MLIIHHNDADGRCAAAIVGRSHYAAGENVEYIEADYGKLKSSDWLREMIDKCRIHKLVFIVDFSLSEDSMIRLVEDCDCDLHWIDHHVSSKDYRDGFKGLRDFTNKGLSGCELAWEYCYPENIMPKIVRMIGDYDTWRLEHDKECKPIIVYLDSMQTAPEDAWWNWALGATTREIEDIINHGRMMTRYRDGYSAGCRKGFGFETVFHDLNCYALNMGRMGSAMMGNEMDCRDACISFFFDGDRFTVSIYSSKPEVDCAEICKKHGGGGHKGAAGFTCDELPFKKTTTKTGELNG